MASLRVRDWMSPTPRTLGRNDKLSLADDLMRMERIRHLPVLDEDGALVGIVSQRDLFRSALARALGYGEAGQRRLLDLLLVKDVMSYPVETVAPEAPLAEAARRLRERGIGCLVVVEDGALAGILTEADFVRHVAEAAPADG